MKRRAPKAKRVDWRKEHASLLVTSGAEIANVRRQRDERERCLQEKCQKILELEKECWTKHWNILSMETERKKFVDFKSDLMLLMASQWDVQCGSKLINVKALQLLLEKYQGSDGLPSARDLDLDAEEKRIAEATK